MNRRVATDSVFQIGNPHVLVTGGSGFIGRAVILELLRQNFCITATTHIPLENLHISNSLKWVVWDTLREPLPEVHWQEIDAIIHLANPTDLKEFPGNVKAMFELGVAAPFRLLDQAWKNGIKRVAIASSGDAIGESKNPLYEDSVEYRPLSFYGAAKACSEILAKSYIEELSVAVLRFFHPFGPFGDQFLVNRLIHNVLEHKKVTIEGESGLMLNPVWVEDLARGVVATVDSSEKGVFHFAGLESVSLKQLLNLIGEVTFNDPIIDHLPDPPRSNHIGLIERTTHLLDYMPSVNLREGIKRVAEAHSKGW